MSKYFGYDTREEFITAIEEGEPGIIYRDSSYIFTLDGRGWNCIPQEIDGREIHSPEMGELTVSADTIEEMIAKVVFSDGVTLNEALEMDTSEYRI